MDKTKSQMTTPVADFTASIVISNTLIMLAASSSLSAWMIWEKVFQHRSKTLECPVV